MYAFQNAFHEIEFKIILLTYHNVADQIQIPPAHQIPNKKPDQKWSGFLLGIWWSWLRAEPPRVHKIVRNNFAQPQAAPKG